MSLATPSQKSLKLFSGTTYPELANDVASYLGCEVSPVEFYTFPNGELYCRLDESVRGSDSFVIQSCAGPTNSATSDSINDSIMEQLLMVDALKRASAKRISVVMPYYPYSRQDKKTWPREPISAKLIADLFRAAGADRIIAIDLHTPQIQGYMDAPLDHLTVLPLLADSLAAGVDRRQLTVVAPDAGRARVAEKYTDRLGCPMAIIHKRRDPGRPGQVEAHDVVGEVRNRVCALVDDLIDTGETMIQASHALFARGASKVLCSATHGIFSGAAIDDLKASKISRVIVTNTLPTASRSGFDRLTVLPIAPVLAKAIRAVFGDDSLSALFSNTK